MLRLTWRVLPLISLIVGLTLLLPGAATSRETIFPSVTDLDVPDEGDAGLNGFGGGAIEIPRSLTTEEEWALIEAEVVKNLARLEGEGHVFAQSTAAVKLQWPLRAADGLNDYGYHGVSGFVDHNPAYPNQRRDYTCGTRTYDLTSGYNHKGTDYFNWPYAWLKVDGLEVEVIAAAPGVLAFKRDGQYDRNCAMTSALSNAVVIRHDDGTTASYLHMKRGSVTTRPVGARVEQGEYLGVVASSGSSTGPHLHFEIKDAAGKVIDPYMGVCNPVPSMWEEQPPYYDSRINRVQTGFSTWRANGCPNPETPNIRDSFDVTEAIYFTVFYRDRRAGQESVCRLYEPDGTLHQTWTSTSATAYGSASYSWWSRTLGDSAPTGTWRFEVTYEGEAYTTYFNFGAPTYITVTLPNGGEVWKPGMVVPLAWKDNLGGAVRLDLLRDGAYVRTITKATTRNSVFFWYIPTDLEPGDGYALRVTNVTNPSLFDTSDATFSLSSEARADFHAVPLTGSLPLTVNFTDDSTGGVSAWLWHFGDGSTSTAQHPSHTYTEEGAYTVDFTITNLLGSDTLTRVDYITVRYPPLTPAFHAWPMLGLAPLTVSFADRTTGPPVLTRLWAFGDGVTSSQDNPTHTYMQTGTYTAALAVTTAEETASVSRVIHVVDQLWLTYLPVVSRR